MKFLILGRTASGKDTLASILTYKYGWKFVKSYTTRPKRFDSEDTHIFISEKDCDEIVSDNIIANTVINNYKYFATRQQLEEADAYIIDPVGLESLLEKMKDTKFMIIYLYPCDLASQRVHALERGSSEESVFNNRYSSEDGQFAQFELSLDNQSLLKSENIFDVIRFVNMYNLSFMEYFAHSLNIIKSFCKECD